MHLCPLQFTFPEESAGKEASHHRKSARREEAIPPEQFLLEICNLHYVELISCYSYLFRVQTKKSVFVAKSHPHLSSAL